MGTRMVGRIENKKRMDICFYFHILVPKPESEKMCIKGVGIKFRVGSTSFQGCQVLVEYMWQN